MTLSDPSKWLKMGDFAKNEKKNKENGKNQVRHVGRLLTVFNKFVILGLILMQNLMPDDFAHKG